MSGTPRSEAVGGGGEASVEPSNQIDEQEQEVTPRCCFSERFISRRATSGKTVLTIYKPEKKALEGEVRKSDRKWKQTNIYKKLCEKRNAKGCKIKWMFRRIPTSRTDHEGSSSGSSGCGAFHHFVVVGDAFVIQFTGTEDIYVDGQVKLEPYIPNKLDEVYWEECINEGHKIKMDSVLGIISYSLTTTNCETIATFIFTNLWFTQQAFESKLVQEVLLQKSNKNLLEKIGRTPEIVRKELPYFSRDYFFQDIGDKKNIVVVDTGTENLERIINLRDKPLFRGQQKVPEFGYFVQNDVTFMVPARDIPKYSDKCAEVLHSSFMCALISRTEKIKGIALLVTDKPDREYIYNYYNEHFKKSVPFLALIHKTRGKRGAIRAWNDLKRNESAIQERQGAEFGRCIEVKVFPQDRNWANVIGQSEMVRKISVETNPSLNFP